MLTVQTIKERNELTKYNGLEVYVEDQNESYTFKKGLFYLNRELNTEKIYRLFVVMNKTESGDFLVEIQPGILRKATNEEVKNSLGE